MKISPQLKRGAGWIALAALVTSMCAGCSSGPEVVQEQGGRPASAVPPPPPSKGGPVHMKPNPNSPANMVKH